MYHVFFAGSQTIKKPKFSDDVSVFSKSYSGKLLFNLLNYFILGWPTYLSTYLIVTSENPFGCFDDEEVERERKGEMRDTQKPLVRQVFCTTRA
jgi:hypothetical protein